MKLSEHIEAHPCWVSLTKSTRNKWVDKAVQLEEGNAKLKTVIDKLRAHWVMRHLMIWSEEIHALLAEQESE